MTSVEEHDLRATWAACWPRAQGTLVGLHHSPNCAAPCHPGFAPGKTAGDRFGRGGAASAPRKRLIAEAPVLVENRDRLHLDEVLGDE